MMTLMIQRLEVLSVCNSLAFNLCIFVCKNKLFFSRDVSYFREKGGVGTLDWSRQIRPSNAVLLVVLTF